MRMVSMHLDVNAFTDPGDAHDHEQLGEEDWLATKLLQRLRSAANWWGVRDLRDEMTNVIQVKNFSSDQDALVSLLFDPIAWSVPTASLVSNAIANW